MGDSVTKGAEYQDWYVDPDSLPEDATQRERLRFAVRLATLAPSSHNTQPWRFRLHGDRIEVFVDRERGLPVVDPQERELFVSCGAAALTLRVALAGLGVEHTYDVQASTESDLAMTIQATGRSHPTEAQQRLLRAIPKRHTKRVPFEDSPVSSSIQEQLIAAVTDEQSQAFLVERGEQHSALAKLVMEGDRTQFADNAFRQELSGWIRNPKHGGDGLPPHATGQPDALAPVTSLIIRTIDLGKSRAKADSDLVDHSPLLAAIATADDSPASCFEAGQALARLLLVATANSIDASFVNQPIEVPPLRPQVQDVLGTQALPQILLRLGRGPTVTPSPRRPLADVLTED